MTFSPPSEMSLPEPATLLARNGRRLPVHPLTNENGAALGRFDAGLSAETRSVFWPHAYDSATLARHSQRHAQGRDRSYLLFAADDVVGYFFLWEFDQPVPLLGLGLTDTWQGQGLGAQMLDRLIAEARAGHRNGVELTTVTTNIRAFRLYRRAGFEPLGEVDNVAGDGRVVREHRMFLPLQSGAVPPDRVFRPPS